MTLDLNLDLLTVDPSLSLNQLVFVSLVKNDIKVTNQNVSSLVSLIDETEIQELIDKSIITRTIVGKKYKYELTGDFIQKIKDSINTTSFFDEFYELYPAYITRNDGTKDYLRANVNKCRQQYNRIVGQSKELHDHILNCLRAELSDKHRKGKMGFMKRMWKWLTSNEWEAYEEYLNDNSNYNDTPIQYGTEII